MTATNEQQLIIKFKDAIINRLVGLCKAYFNDATEIECQGLGASLRALLLTLISQPNTHLFTR